MIKRRKIILNFFKLNRNTTYSASIDINSRNDGSEYKSYKLKREKKLEDLNCNFKHFENESTKLKHYLFDSNINIKKGFCIIFKTPNEEEEEEYNQGLNIPFTLSSLLISKISNIDNILSNLKIKNGK